MKKIKITLAAVAFLMATGLAFASNAHQSNLTACKGSTRVAEGCQENNPTLCCTDNNNVQYFGDYIQP